jgi:cellulose synthase/poly-beta-1,6-N-acetylglucosamine synthase-like glycosyltransferase
MKNVERKISSAINAASVHPFISTAWIICISIHILHLCINSVNWSCIKALSIFFLSTCFTIGTFSFCQIHTYRKNCSMFEMIVRLEVKNSIESRKTTKADSDSKVLHPMDYIWRSLFDQGKNLSGSLNTSFMS